MIPEETRISTLGTNYAGNYSVVVSNAFGYVTSAVAVLTVQPTPINPDPERLVFIPEGPFQMGDKFNEGYSNEVPVHTVYVSAFYMDKYIVTKALWDEVYQWAVSHDYSFDNAGSGKAANHPVQTIDWYDAVKWCNARSEKEGRTPAYYTSAGQTTVYRSGQTDVQNEWVRWNAGYRLPTEAEWEKAARGGASGHRFPWSDMDTITHSRANYNSFWSDPGDVSPTHGYHPTFNDGLEPYTSPAGYFAPNGYGLYDMAGNVFGWCWDWMGDYSSNSQTDPRGPASGSRRMGRGGSWYASSFYCRAAYRYNGTYYPTFRYYDLGFRAVLAVDPGGSSSTNPPSISRQPQEQVRTVGGSATFDVQAYGAPPLTYQWRLNGANLNEGGRITGAMSETLDISPLQTNDAGNYSVVVSNTFGSATSTLAVLTVQPTPINPDPEMLALIPEGSFQMGDPFNDNAENNSEVPVHTVYVSAFYIDKYEVTKALWDEVYNWATNHGYGFDNAGSSKAVNHPVQMINWYDMVKWCNARSEKEGLTPAYYTSAAQATVYRSGQLDLQDHWVEWNAGYRLPTGAEWEKAARGGANGHRFPWPDADTITQSRANYNSEGGYAYDINQTRGYHAAFNDGVVPYTSPVGYFAPNGYGLYDMAGNVWELCWDWFSYSYYGESPGSDPHGPESGSGRVFRGGSWLSSYGGYGCRAACYSLLSPPTLKFDDFGFRSVLACSSSSSRPTISSQPKDQVGDVGASVTFDVQAHGAPSLTYQWWLNGVDLTEGGRITGTMTATLRILALTTNDTGNYSVVVSDAHGSVTSAVARLTVSPVVPLDHWSSRNSGKPDDLFAITYGDGRFVAVGDTGTILASTNGLNWTDHSVFDLYYLNGVTYGNGLYVAVGGSGGILTSPDSVSWTDRSGEATSADLRDVAYGNGVYVAIGTAGTILISADADIWETIVADPNQDLNPITFANGAFVVVGQRNSDSVGIILTSADGATWSEASPGTPPHLRGIGAGPGGIVVVGNGGSFLTSTNSSTWAGTTVSCPGGAVNLRACTYGDGAYVVMGNGGTILSSETAFGWTCRPSGTAVNLHSVAFGQGTFVAVGSGGTILQAVASLPLTLSVRTSGPNLVTLSWPGAPDVRLQTATNLADPDWQDVPGSEGMNSINLPVTDGPAFFRLVKGALTPANMALIPAGTFQMGDTFSEGNPIERPVHTVYVSAFYMDKYLVTQTLWDDVYDWAVTHGYSFDNAGSGKATNHPVHSVSWYDAVKWCNARSQKEGRTPAYYTDAGQSTVYQSGRINVQNDWVKWDAGYRLPTEAEWEKAARGGSAGHRFPWTDGETISHSRANYFSTNWSGEVSTPTPYDVSSTRGYHPAFNDGVVPYTSPVDYFPPNGYGLYDMTGNVVEWCWEWEGGAYPSGSQTDPRGPASGWARMHRKQAWSLGSFCGRAASRRVQHDGPERLWPRVPKRPASEPAVMQAMPKKTCLNHQSSYAQIPGDGYIRAARPAALCDGRRRPRRRSSARPTGKGED